MAKSLVCRWASPAEFEYYAQGLKPEYLRKILRRGDRTLRDWRSGRRPIPMWAVGVLRLHFLETRQAFFEMTGKTAPAPRLVASAGPVAVPVASVPLAAVKAA